METAGELDAFRQQVMEEGDTGDHFQNDVTVTDADGKPIVSRTKTELNQNVAALYYDRTALPRATITRWWSGCWAITSTTPRC